MTITISVPESWKAFIDAEVAAGGYDSPAAYIETLLLQAKLRTVRDNVERLVDESLQEAGGREWTPEVREDLRRAVRERRARQTGNGS